MDLHVPLICENCKNVVNIKKINPVISCENCRNGRLRLDNCLTNKYVKSKEFRSSPPTSWKYLYNLIPITSERRQNVHNEIIKSIVSLDEGGTPLRISKIGTKFNLSNLRIKDETRNPTTSYMDRGTSAEISMCRWLGQSNNHKNTITGSVVGRLAVSLAAYSARAGFNCELSVLDNQEWGLSPDVLYQLIVYGTKINLANKQKVFPSNYHRFSYNNTFFTEGLKSLGFEICEQLGWKLPDRIIVPLGQGTLIYALDHSIKELVSLGLVENNGKRNKNVKIHGVTAEENLLLNTGFSQANSFGDSLKNKNINKRVHSIPNPQTSNSDLQKSLTTIAPELFPPRMDSYQNEAMTVINNSGGSVIRVSDSELMDAVSFLAQTDGIFASPAGVSSISGLFKLIESNAIDDYDENIVCIATMGHGSSSNDVLKNWKTLDVINKIRYQHRQIIKRGSISEKNKKIAAYPIGNTKTRILSLLKNYPDYAYNLHKRAVKKYTLKIDISTLYQHLNELEKMGAISKSKAESFRGKPIRIYYTITPYGSSLIGSNSFKKN